MATASTKVQCVRKDCIADPRDPYHHEPHLCFVCGAQWYPTPELLKTSLCPNCNWLKCPVCLGCRCSLTEADANWVDSVRSVYCQSVEKLAEYRAEELESTANPNVRAGLGLQLMFCNRWALCELERRKANSWLSILGRRVARPIAADELECFPSPGVDRVDLMCEEVTTLCPVTGQPDFLTVTVSYVPDNLCIETKSLKLYLWSFRNKGIFAESLAVKILNALAAVSLPLSMTVKVEYKSRGGILLSAAADYNSVPF